MKIITVIDEMKQFSKSAQSKGLSIGFVPTMGYLHEGHVSLIDKSVKENDITVVSIFVNPTQFAPNEDLDKYPRDFERDCMLVEKVGADVIFFPDAPQMYPHSFSTYVTVENLTAGLCGMSRPSHFRGVTTVVAKLFNIVMPRNAYFGQKDYQQYRVISQMVHDLDMDVSIVPCPIVREDDGLAKSSRNVYLSAEERAQAPALHKSLKYAEMLVKNGESRTSVLKSAISDFLTREAASAKIDYIELADPFSLSSIAVVPQKPEGERALIALAVYFGKTRLIDNIVI